MTVRAILIGLLMSAFIGMAVPYSNMVIRGSAMGLWATQSAALFLFFVLAGLVNTLLRLVRRSAGLTPPELLVIFVMITCANAVPSRGVVGYIFPLLTSATYYATAENEWVRILFPHMAGWMSVLDPVPVRDLYEGLPPGERLPWGVWLRPLAAWGVFLVVLHVVIVSAAVVLRRQWMDNERIPYPMAQLPLAMVADDDSGKAIAPFFRNPLMWVGFAFPFIDQTMDALYGYHRFIPYIAVFRGSISLFDGAVSFGVTPYFTVLGFAFFTSTSVGYGLCFFHVLNQLQEAAIKVWGLAETDPTMGVFSGLAPAPILHQSMGAMAVLVLFGLWIGRDHLRAVFRKAWGDPEVDDADEILSYRGAVAGFVVGTLFLAGWLALGGLPLWIAIAFVLVAMVIFTAMTRVVAQGGLPAIWPPTNAVDAVASGVGPSMIGPAGLVVLGFTYIWATDILNFAMAPVANGLRLSREVASRRRRLFWAIMGAIAVSMASAMVTTMVSCYREGGLNLAPFYFQTAAQYPWEYAAEMIPEPPGASLMGWVHTSVGATAMVALMWMHRRFLWWPFHPLGFPISSVLGGMWFSVLLAMVIKSLVLKYGGVGAYRRTQPVFLGFILGSVSAAGLWNLIDFFTGMKGNSIFWL